MLYKIGTVNELETVRGKLPRGTYPTVHQIVAVLDKEYGADRNIDKEDGGFVLVAETVADLEQALTAYPVLGALKPEQVNICNGGYINALFLCNNEFGINLLMPRSLAPKKITDEI